MSIWFDVGLIEFLERQQRGPVDDGVVDVGDEPAGERQLAEVLAGVSPSSRSASASAAAARSPSHVGADPAPLGDVLVRRVDVGLALGAVDRALELARQHDLVPVAARSAPLTCAGMSRQ